MINTLEELVCSEMVWEIRIKIVIIIHTLEELVLFSDDLRIIFNLFSPILSPLGPWTCCRRSAVNIIEFLLVVNYFSFCAFLFSISMLLNLEGYVDRVKLDLRLFHLGLANYGRGKLWHFDHKSLSFEGKKNFVFTLWGLPPTTSMTNITIIFTSMPISVLK